MLKDRATVAVLQIIADAEVEPRLDTDESNLRLWQFLRDEFHGVEIAVGVPQPENDIFYRLEEQLIDLDCEIEDISDKILQLETRLVALKDERNRIQDEYHDPGGDFLDALTVRRVQHDA